MKTVAIIQARMGSTRLPGKVLKPILGQPMLYWVWYRTSRSRLLDDIVIATTTNSGDDVIVDLCNNRGWNVFRGSEDDVLDRYFQAARHAEADTVVRITSDCPLIDSGVIDYSVSTFYSLPSRLDYVSAEAPQFPRGLDVEVLSRGALALAHAGDPNPDARQHVTLPIRNAPHRYRSLLVTSGATYPESEYRWTVDTVDDLVFAREVYNHFENGDFSWLNVLDIIESHPEIQRLNLTLHDRQNNHE